MSDNHHRTNEATQPLTTARIPVHYQHPKPIATVDESFAEAIWKRPDDKRTKDWKLLIQGAVMARQVHRFADLRQTEFDGTPLPDGSNIFWAPAFGRSNGSEGLWRQFLWYKDWLTFLHYDGVVTLLPEREEELRLNRYQLMWSNVAEDVDTCSVEELHDLRNTQIMYHLDQNLAKTPEVDQTYLNPPELNWVHQWRESIMELLQEMQRAYQSTEGGQEAIDAAMQKACTIFYVRQLTREKVFATRTEPTWLLIRLAKVGYEFEQALTEWHVEDQEMSKRVFLMNDHDAGVVGLDNMRRVYEYFWPQVHNSLKETSRASRENFEYRRLRDWGYGRPWSKLCLVVDCSNKEGHRNGDNANEGTPRMTLKDAVKTINGLFNSSGKLGYDLFDVHPVDMDDLPKDERCAVCRGDYEDAELLARTHCKHYFHAACLLQSWDASWLLDFRCPTCRQGDKELSARVEIEVEYEALTSYDAEADELQEERAEQAKAWIEAHGNDYQMPQELWLAMAQAARKFEQEKEREEAMKKGQGVIP